MSSTNKKVIIVLRADGLRFDRYCATHIEELSSLKRAKKWIKAGYLQLNGTHCESSRFLQDGDKISLCLPLKELNIWERKLTVHFEDEFLAIVEKPPGIPVSGNRAKTLRLALPFNLRNSIQPDALFQPEPIHRLDRRTSGLIIIAKTNHSRHLLGTMLERREIEKNYQCLCIGSLSDAQSNSPIEGKEAQTNWTCLSTQKSHFTGSISHLHLTISTGRQHQIRRHLHELGHPILGDDLYSIGRPLRSKGLYLFSTALHFVHPLTNEEIQLTLPTPPKILKRLKYEQRCYSP